MSKLILLIWVFDPCSSLGGLDNYKVQTGAMVYTTEWVVGSAISSVTIFHFYFIHVALLYVIVIFLKKLSRDP